MQNFNPQQLAQLRRWILCLAVIKFDIDEGQLVQYILPANSLSKIEEKNLAMLSFPDSNSFDGQEGTVKYVFRLRRDNNRHFFGFTCFKQKKDANLFRGYFQKSLVIVSELPLIEFYQKLAQFLVFKTFTFNECLVSELEKVCRQILNWPNPTPSTSLKLNVLGYDFNVDIPCYRPARIENIDSIKNNNNLQESISESPVKSPSGNKQDAQENSLTSLLKMQALRKAGYYQDSNLFQPYKCNIEILWHLWEKILLNKSVILISDKPSSVSHGVLGALSLISPLEFASPFKPYLTIYDPDFLLIQKAVESKTLGCLILGATNPLFLKVLKGFPCLINLEDTYTSQSKKLTPIRLNTYVIPDKNFSKQLMHNVTEEKIAINEALLRKYFRRFTENFLSKFDDYFFKQANDLKRFDKAEFIKCLKKQQFEFEECFESRSDIIKLYDQFCDSANCRLYLSRRNVMRLISKT